jgi:hypothetical protein
VDTYQAGSAMSAFSPSSPQFELRKSNSAIVDYAVPRYTSVEHFCATYHAAISEIEIIGINGGQFVDLESSKARLIMLRARFK